MGTFVKLVEVPKRPYVIFSIINILDHVYRNNDAYMKIQSFILVAFSKVFDEIGAKPDIVHGDTKRAVLVGYRCVLKILCLNDALHLSREDLNHEISILKSVRASFLYLHKRN